MDIALSIGGEDIAASTLAVVNGVNAQLAQQMSQVAQNRRVKFLFAGLLTLITLLNYFPALRGDFIWDDDRHVSDNHTLLSLHGLKHIWLDPKYLPQWYPLTHTSFWIEYRFFTLHTIGYHVDNVLLHVINALLLWRLLRLLKIPGAALAATVFALHPIEVESVAWISERKNLLSCCFMLLSIDTYLRNERWGNAAGSLLFFILAMLSKTVACATPAVLLVLLAWQRGVRRRDILQLLPFFIVGIGLSTFTAWTESHYVGASGPEWNISIISRCLIAGRAVWFYAYKLLIPSNLTFNYPRWKINPRLYWQELFPIALMVAIGAFWMLRRRIGAGAFVAAIIFIGVLFPALGFINTYPMRYCFVADHFQYAAGIALIALVSVGVVRIVPERIAVVVAALLLSILTARQSRAYAGPDALWSDVIFKNPQSWLAWENLAIDRSLHGHAADALPMFAHVEQLKPDHEMLQANWADALASLGRWSEAITHYQLALNSPQGDRSVIHDRIGLAFVKLGHLPEAISQFHLALSANENNAVARVHLAEALSAGGDDVQSLVESGHVLAQLPDATEALAASARAMLNLNRPNEALTCVQRLVVLEPADRKNRLFLARLLMQLNRPAEAATQYSALLDRDPNDAAAKKELLDALAKRGPTTR